MTNPILEVVDLRICVCGGRDYINVTEFIDFMEDIFLPRIDKDAVTIIQGGASGADALAQAWSTLHNIKSEEFPAKWYLFGRAAGKKRNKEMLDSGLDFLIAFDGGTGTHHMMDICRGARVPILTEHNIDKYLSLSTK